MQPLPPAARACYPRRNDNSIAIVTDGFNAFTEIVRDILDAERSVWVTVAFVELDLPMPGTDRTFLELLEDTARKGVDVRVVFWKSDFPFIKSFNGSKQDIEMLTERRCPVKMRWDYVRMGCHHQKSFVIDGEIGWCGGINLQRDYIDDASHPHRQGRNIHDHYARVTGPCVRDMEANFVQRWNEASEWKKNKLAHPNADVAGDLDLPEGPLSAPERPERLSTVQVQRTIKRNHYARHYPVPGGVSEFDITAGENSIRLNKMAAIDAAETLIYIEDQFMLELDMLNALIAAAERGVEVVCLLPGQPSPQIAMYQGDYLTGIKTRLNALPDVPHLNFYEIANNYTRKDGGMGLNRIYIHAKLMIVDDTWLTVGSANISWPSLFRDSEMNLSIWDQEHAQGMRKRLWREHLGPAIGAPDQLEGAALWRDHARDNVALRDKKEAIRSRVLPLDMHGYYGK